MNTPKRITLAVLALLALMNPVYAKEDLADKFNAMWNRTQSQTNRVNGAYGGTLGGVSVRAPIRNWKIISVSPPKFEAGCGGIDLHFGSFSFISTENIEQLLRNIISSATGYAIQLALENICPSCSEIAGEFRDLTASLNFDTLNTCQMSSEAIDWALGRGNYEGKNIKQRVETMEAAWNNKQRDITDAMKNIFNKNGDPNANRDYQAHNKDTSYGNNLLNTFVSAGVFDGEHIDTKPYDGNQGFFEITLSLIGTNILKTGEKKDNESDQYVEPIWTFDDLVHGVKTNESLDILACTDFSTSNAGSCQNVTHKPAQYSGVERYAIEMIAGKQTSMGDAQGDSAVSEITDDSIIAYLNGQIEIEQLSESRRAFVDSLPPQYMQALQLIAKKYQRNPKIANAAVQLVANAVAKQYAAQLAQGIIRTTRGAYNASLSDKKTAQLSEKQEAALSKLEQASQKVLDTADSDAEKFKEAVFIMFSRQDELNKMEKEDKENSTENKQPA